MSTIGLVAAMPQESNALLHLNKGYKRMAVHELPAFSFSISGQPCVLVTSGMGLKRANRAAEILMDTFSLSRLISFGIAGAVEVDLEIGDVVLADAYCQLEMGSPGKVTRLCEWSPTAQEAAQQALANRGRHLFTGTAITTTGSQVTPMQLTGIPHPVLEMETAGIAQAAAHNGIPILSLRAISDGPRDPIPLDLSRIMDEDANLIASRLLMAVIRNPRIIFRSGRVLSNTTIAAQNAALALTAALSRWGK
jgi:adenosylhomocysteine nucleosidase